MLLLKLHYYVGGSKTFILNTIYMAAASLDVIIGTAIAYIVIRTGIFGRQWLDYLGNWSIGCSRCRAWDRISLHGVDVPFTRVRSWWFNRASSNDKKITLCLRACTAALQQVSITLEDFKSIGATKRE